MKILVVGDVVGESGLEKLKVELRKIKETENIDFIVVNAENVAGGMGITVNNFNELKKLNIDVITMGNHTWAKKDIFTFIDDDKIIRPANYSKGVPGKGYNIYECNGKKIGVINLIGRTNMGVLSENPFTVVDSILEKIKHKVDIIIVDFHAEATAEKIAMANYLDGKVTAVFGTHTHVQTADERILPKGTAYISDIGMTGTKNSALGMDVSVALKRFETSLPERYKVASGEGMLNGVIYDIDDNTNKVKTITRINM